jgi:hypothetical protein
VNQLAHRGGRGRVAHQEDRIGLPVEQRVLGGLALEVEQLRAPARLDPVRLEERLREDARTASFAPDGDALAVQLGEEPDRLRRPVEEEDRHVEDAAERHEVVRVAEARDPALHEPDVDLEPGIAQALEILERALRRKDLQRHALLGEDLRVAPRIAPGTCCRPRRSSSRSWSAAPGSRSAA